jgi:DNA-binding NarL/FixJ family response regulator
MQNRATGVATQATISAIVVDDETLASEELAYLLKEFADVEIVATAANGIEAVKLIEDLEPDLAAREGCSAAVFRDVDGLRSIRGGGVQVGGA